MANHQTDYLVEPDTLADDTPCQCDSCDWKGPLSALGEIEQTILTPGCEVPAGRCPNADCYALAYVVPAPAPRLTIYTLTIDHKHGSDVRVFRSEEGALDALAAWARDWWPKECAPYAEDEGAQAMFDALDDGEAIKTYFEAMNGRESYSLDSTILEG